MFRTRFGRVSDRNRTDNGYRTGQFEPDGNKKTSPTVNAVMKMPQTAKDTKDTPAPPRARREKRGSHAEKKAEAWLQQHGALQALAYRLTLTHHVKKSFNVGKRKSGSERFFTADEVFDRLPLLAAKNSQGYNVYVTPIKDLEHYIVLDDTTSAALDALKAHGFMPCLIQESSPGNLQAIFRVERQPDFEREQSTANAVVCRLNMKFGDPAFSGVVHPFRLAGFANRKERYLKHDKYPFVRVLRAQAVTCRKLSEVIERERQKIKEASLKPTRGKKHRQAQAQVDPGDLGVELIERFSGHWNQIYEGVAKKGLKRDRSRIDFHVAKMMLEKGYTVSQVAYAIKQASPGVSERHSDIDDYARRTVSNAQRGLS